MLFRDLLNQNQACWYLFQCIFHGDSKYGHEIPKCWHFYQICYILDLSSAHISKCYFEIYWTKTRHVGTYFNAFFMVIPNMVMKFQNVDIFYQICYIFNLSSAHACRVENIIVVSCVRYVLANMCCPVMASLSQKEFETL